MPIQMKKSGDGSFDLTIEDRFDPSEDYTVEVMDMDTYSGVSKIDGKPFTSLKWIYRVYDQDGLAFVDQVSGEAWEGVEFSSLSLFGTAKGRGWADAFLGHTLTDEECDAIADNFDGAIIGKRARASFKLVEKKSADGAVLGRNLTWALLRPLLKPAAPKRAASRPAGPSAQTLADDAAIKASVAPKASTNGDAPVSQFRETAAQRRARLQAEMEAIPADDDDDDNAPF
jgi:hypothetical protein